MTQERAQTEFTSPPQPLRGNRDAPIIGPTNPARTRVAADGPPRRVCREHGLRDPILMAQPRSGNSVAHVDWPVIPSRRPDPRR